MQSNAFNPACCAREGGVRNRLPMRARAVSIRSGGKTTQPSRQPAMEKYLEKLFTTTASGANSSIDRSEEHTSELQSLMRISYAVFCLKKKNNKKYAPTKNAISRY